MEDTVKALGERDPWFVVGIAIGTTVYDKLHYALDVSYKILSNEDNIGVLRGALIYDLSKKTSILAEGEFSQHRENETQSRQVLMAGLTYKPTRNWIVGFYGGGQINDGKSDNTDSVAAMKVSYSFRSFIF